MPSIITVQQLRSALGNPSTSLYSDAYLSDVIDTSEIVILSMLDKFAAPIASAWLTDNVATFITQVPHEFTTDSSVVITGCGSPFNGTHTVLEDWTEYSFSVDITNADIDFKNFVPAGLATLTGASTYVGNSAVESAVLVVSLDVFRAQTAPAGSIQGIDFAPTPYPIGRAVFARVQGILGSFIDVGTIAQ